MRFGELMRSIFISMRTSKIRTFLTTLGVIVGSLTIIVVVGIGKGGEQQIADQYSFISADTINVRQNRTYTGTKTLDVEQMADLSSLQGVRAAGLSISTSSDVSFGSNTVNASIMGISESMVIVNSYEIEHGSFFTDLDGETRERVVVLGNTLAESLFGEQMQQTAVGEQIKIGGRKYTVVGVMARKGDSGGFMSGVDDSLLAPFGTAAANLIGRFYSTSITVKATSAKTVAIAKEAIINYIAEFTQTEDAYTVSDQGSMLSSAMESATTMSALLIAVAAVVLVVGGIGIMNVLLVSVRERTREIGILKSIGAKRADIIKEFLMEAIIVSFSGGGLGVLLSFAAIPIINMTGTTILYSYEGVLLGLLFSIVTGVFFGFYPALKASKLKPIDALNTDG